jgi:hypothetical protein
MIERYPEVEESNRIASILPGSRLIGGMGKIPGMICIAKTFQLILMSA